MLARSFERTGQTENVGPCRAVEQSDFDEHHLPGRDGARLVEDDGADAPRLLEDFGTLDQDAELRSASGSDHQRRRRRQTECARARDDQHGDCRGEGIANVPCDRKPADEGAEGNDQHDRDEHSRDAVDQTLDRRLARLSLRDEPGDLGQRGLRTDLRRADDESAVRVDRRPRNRLAGLDLDRHRFPGEHRLVDRRVPLDHDSVGCDFLPRPDDEHIADLQLIHAYQHLRAVSEDACLLGSELEQRANRCA